MGAVEVVRQVGLVVSHLGYGIPLDFAFTIQEIEAVWFDAAPQFPTFGPLEMLVTVVVSSVSERKGVTSGMTMNVTLAEFGVGLAVHRALAPKDYAIMRRHAPAKGSLPPRSDDALLRDVARDGAGVNALLGWNEPGNPFVFDHPVDHIPGMALVDGALAAHSLLHGGRVARGVRMHCTSFAELDRDVRLDVVRSDGDTAVSFSQSGTAFGEVTIYG